MLDARAARDDHAKQIWAAADQDAEEKMDNGVCIHPAFRKKYGGKAAAADEPGAPAETQAWGNEGGETQAWGSGTQDDEEDSGKSPSPHSPRRRRRPPPNAGHAPRPARRARRAPWPPRPRRSAAAYLTRTTRTEARDGLKQAGGRMLPSFARCRGGVTPACSLRACLPRAGAPALRQAPWPCEAGGTRADARAERATPSSARVDPEWTSEPVQSRAAF